MSSISKPGLTSIITSGFFPEPTGLMIRSDDQYSSADGKEKI